MLQDQAMIANLNIRSWTARKHDKTVSDEVDKTHGAKDAGRYNKMLIDKVALDPLSKHAGRIRDYHYTMTLPWGDNGDRLLPARAYMDYTAAMRKFKDESAQLTSAFVTQYPALVASARQRLGTMYDAKDYPPTDHIKERFGVSISFAPVPDANDFRVDVDKEALDEIRESINASVAERQAGAVKECWLRLNDVVSKLYDMMIKEKPIFRDSIIDNVRDLVNMLPKLNITNDSALNKICEDIALQLIVPPRILRNNPKSRANLAANAEKLLRVIAERL